MHTFSRTFSSRVFSSRIYFDFRGTLFCLPSAQLRSRAGYIYSGLGFGYFRFKLSYFRLGTRHSGSAHHRSARRSRLIMVQSSGLGLSSSTLKARFGLWLEARLSSAQVRIDLARGSAIGAGHIARIVTQARLGLA